MEQKSPDSAHNETRNNDAMTFLAIDVGNTRLKWALYDAPEPGAAVLHQGVEFLENIDRLADVDWVSLQPPKAMLGCIVAGEAVKRRVQEQMEIWDVAPQWVVSSAAQAFRASALALSSAASWSTKSATENSCQRRSCSMCYLP